MCQTLKQGRIVVNELKMNSNLCFKHDPSMTTNSIILHMCNNIILVLLTYTVQ